MFGCAGCIDDLGESEISGRRDDGFIQPDGFGKPPGAFLGLLDSYHCAVHCGLRTVRIFAEEMILSAIGPEFEARQKGHEYDESPRVS